MMTTETIARQLKDLEVSLDSTYVLVEVLCRRLGIDTDEVLRNPEEAVNAAGRETGLRVAPLRFSHHNGESPVHEGPGSLPSDSGAVQPCHQRQQPTTGLRLVASSTPP